MKTDKARVFILGISLARRHPLRGEARPHDAGLRTALPWQYGSGVASARVVAIPAELRRKLREAAFRVP